MHGTRAQGRALIRSSDSIIKTASGGNKLCAYDRSQQRLFVRGRHPQQQENDDKENLLLRKAQAIFNLETFYQRVHVM